MCARSTYVGAVEIGTSKIAVVLAEYTGREIIVIGYGVCPSHGVTKGTVVDYRAAAECVAAALATAEHTADEQIDQVYLAQSGGHLDGFYNEGSVTVRDADNMIGFQDIAKVCSLAKDKSLPSGRSIVHEIRRPFRVDGRLVPVSPENLMGEKLEVGYWMVHGDQQRIADSIHVISGSDRQVDELIISSLASGYIVTSQEERQNGVLAIDIGAGTTDFVLYRNGTPHTTGVLAVGGGHFTNDLSVGLRVTMEQAENLKLRFGSAEVQDCNKTEKVWLQGNYSIGDCQFSRQAIEKITAARAWELMDVVRKKLGAAFLADYCPAGIVLTGGGAKLPRLTDCAENVFGAQARLGEALPSVHACLQDPQFHTALGTLYFGLSTRYDHKSPGRHTNGLLERLRRLFSKSGHRR